MCGIAGIVDFKNKTIDRDALKKMVSAQRHRGPDDNGFYFGDNVALGHSRLAIIDLSQNAHQPMANEDSSAFIIHNGEIYNYLELEEDLKGLGHIFRSRSDTEVILHAYEEWGEDCVKHFNGMWAFAILDLKKKVLLCSRDRFGVKPFYYYTDDEVFLFASEIKAILEYPKIGRAPNDGAVFNYLISGYGYMDISDETFFKGIKQLKAGHYIRLSLNAREFTQAKYWDLNPRKKSIFKKEEDAYGNFYHLFEDAVRLRLRSDVSLGVSLSGGLDSSSIACVAASLLNGRPLETFSSCFDEEEYDERKFIRPVLDKTGARPNFIFTKPDNLLEEMGKIIWHQDEPYSTLSIFPQWYVMKLAKDKGVKVLLTGQGGDEVLGGYHKYYLYLFADLIFYLRLKKAMKEMGSYSSLKNDTDKLFHSIVKILLSYATPNGLKKLLKPFYRNEDNSSYLKKDFTRRHTNRIFSFEKKFGSILNSELYNGLKISPLPSLLHIDDRSSMAHSVESRSPFLDYRLVEYLFSLGPDLKIRDGVTKYILRKSLKGILPETVRMRRDKLSFATPLDIWFRTTVKDRVYEILTSREFLGRPYFNKRGVMAKFSDFVEGRDRTGHYAIWSWVSLELWLRKFIDAKG